MGQLHSKSTSSTTSCHGPLASSAIALLAGASLFFAAAATLHLYNQRNQITLDSQSWSWLADIRLHVAAGNTETLIANATVVLPDQARRLVVRRRAPAKTQDQIIQTAAAPEVRVEPAVQVEPVESGVSEAQLLQFQMMHQMLHRQFATALNAEPAPSVQVVSIQAVSIQKPEPTQTARPVVAKKEVVLPAVATPVEKQALREVLIETLKSVPVAGQVKLKPEAASVALEPAKAPSYADLRVQSEPVYRDLAEISSRVFTAEVVSIQKPAPVQASVPTPAPAAQPVATQAPAPVKPVVTAAPVVGTRVAMLGQAGYPTQGDYSFPDLGTLQKLLNTQAQVDTQKAQADESNVAEPFKAVVEAFDWQTEITDSSMETVTTEGWRSLTAANHWPTIYWNPTQAGVQYQGVMLSHNSAHLLETILDRKVQIDTGIVFGKIPSGWNVEISGRAEKVLYLNAQNQVVTTPAGERYFAFLNAEPGSRVVSLEGAIGADTASVVVPVLRGRATYLDLTSVSRKDLSGHVYETKADDMKPLVGATVSVAGQPSTLMLTGSDGGFNLRAVYTVSTYPLYVDVETKLDRGSNHRYRVAPEKMQGIELFRMSAELVQVWLDQLESGVSPESGIVVGALPGLVKKHGEGRLFPLVKTLLSDPTLTPPETYTLSSAGQLDFGPPLEATKGRFVSVQVPEGPAITSVEDNNRQVLWSELLFASPKVINVVGPY